MVVTTDCQYHREQLSGQFTHSADDSQSWRKEICFRATFCCLRRRLALVYYFHKHTRVLQSKLSKLDFFFFVRPGFPVTTLRHSMLRAIYQPIGVNILATINQADILRHHRDSWEQSDESVLISLIELLKLAQKHIVSIQRVFALINHM